MSTRTITVVCQDSGHPSRTPKLLTFSGFRNPREGDDDVRWSARRNHSRSAVPGRNQVSHGSDDWWKRTIDDPDFLPNPPKHGDAFGYEKVIFECGLCGGAFATSNPDRLGEVLTRFWAHGVTEISLSALRAAYTR
jgi:hypothetical protein